MTELSKILQKNNSQNLSTRQIAERATANGYPMSHATVSRYMSGKHPLPANRDVLRGLGVALGVGLGKLEDAANLPNSRSRFELPEKADTLSDPERQAILNLIDVMVQNKGTSSESFHPERSDVALAADEKNVGHVRRREYFDALGEESQEVGEE